ncbi:hypothetical protein X975_09732, partial [Stegodyphus mimosarum]
PASRTNPSLLALLSVMGSFANTLELNRLIPQVTLKLCHVGSE